MSRVISRVPVGRIGLSSLIALAALILTSFIDARPDGGAGPIGAVRHDVPTGGPWCGSQVGIGTKSCRYLTFEQCLTAVGTDYASCRPNPAGAVITDEGPYRTYRSIYL